MPQNRSSRPAPRRQPAASPIADVPAIYALLARTIPSRGPHDFGYLASIDPRQVATVRTVIVAGFDPETHAVWVNTNVGSHKTRHLRKFPEGELCLWLHKPRIQLRLRAEWRVVDATLAGRNSGLAKLRQQAWEDQPKTSKLLYAEPGPDGAMAVPDDVPSAFAVLLGSLYQIDVLRITRTGYEQQAFQRVRTRWQSITP